MNVVIYVAKSAGKYIPRFYLPHWNLYLNAIDFVTCHHRDTWLKMQRTCPICRIETHKSNLSKLILK